MLTQCPQLTTTYDSLNLITSIVDSRTPKKNIITKRNKYFSTNIDKANSK